MRARIHAALVQTIQESNLSDQEKRKISRMITFRPRVRQATLDFITEEALMAGVVALDKTEQDVPIEDIIRLIQDIWEAIQKLIAIFQ